MVRIIIIITVELTRTHRFIQTSNKKFDTTQWRQK